MKVKQLGKGLSVNDVFSDGGNLYKIDKVYEDGNYSSNLYIKEDDEEEADEPDGEPREIDILRAKATELGIPFQKVWGVNQLQKAIEKAENK